MYVCCKICRFSDWEKIPILPVAVCNHDCAFCNNRTICCWLQQRPVLQMWQIIGFSTGRIREGPHIIYSNHKLLIAAYGRGGFLKVLLLQRIQFTFEVKWSGAKLVWTAFNVTSRGAAKDKVVPSWLWIVGGESADLSFLLIINRWQWWGPWGRWW